jgi:hypothetical protein
MVQLAVKVRVMYSDDGEFLPILVVILAIVGGVGKKTSLIHGK